MKTTTRSIAMNGPMNELSMNLSSFFIPVKLLEGDSLESFKCLLEAGCVLPAGSCEPRLSAAAALDGLRGFANICGCILACGYKILRVHQQELRLAFDNQCGDESSVSELFLKNRGGVAQHCRIRIAINHF